MRSLAKCWGWVIYDGQVHTEEENRRVKELTTYNSMDPNPVPIVSLVHIMSLAIVQE